MLRMCVQIRMYVSALLYYTSHNIIRFEFFVLFEFCIPSSSIMLILCCKSRTLLCTEEQMKNECKKKMLMKSIWLKMLRHNNTHARYSHINLDCVLFLFAFLVSIAFFSFLLFNTNVYINSFSLFVCLLYHWNGW